MPAQFLRLCAILTAALCCLAAQAVAGPAYRLAVPSDPATDEWQNGFSISLLMDEKRCRNEYGQDWTRQCAAPLPGEEGRRVDGVRMTPVAAGQWRWESGETMRFYSEKPLTPGTRYAVSLEKVLLPARFNLRRDLTYTSQPQAARVGKESLWIDPSPKAAHAVSVPVRFIWPVNTQDMEGRISLAAADPKSGLILGAPRFVWNESRDELVVSAPLAALAENNAAARMVVRGLPAFSVKEGRRILAESAGKNRARGVEALFSVTGRSRLMDVTSITVSPAYDRDLDKEYRLEVKTTLRVLPSQMLRRLDVIQLPRRSMPEAGQDADWTLMPAISAEDVRHGEKLTPQLLQPADEPADRILLRVPATAGRGLLAAVEQGLPSLSGPSLRETRRFILNVPSLGAELHFLQPGNVLTLSGEKKLDLHAVGLTAIEWRAERVREPFLALLAEEAGFASPHADFDRMSDVLQGRLDLQKSGAEARPGAASFPVLDAAELLRGPNGARHGLMRLTLTGYAGEKQAAQCTRLVLITDLGLTLKTAADGSRAVFVQHLGTGKPVAGAQVRLLGVNGLPTLTATTDAQGRADLPAMRGLEREKRSVAVVAVAPADARKDAQSGTADSLGRDMAWLSLNDAARRVDYSDFAVAGRHSASGGLSASVFSQRGLYLPGETLHFGCIVRRFDWACLPPDLPLEAVLVSPTGAEVLRRPFSVGPDGLNAFDWNSPEDAAAGTYRLDVRLADSGAGPSEATPVLGSAVARVEEFQPDTLALAAAFEPQAPKGWIRVDPKGGAPAVQARLDNLYGEPAAGHRVRATFHTSPARLRFAGYEDYTFFDATPPGGEARSLSLPEARTDAGGLTRFSLPLGGLAAGTVRGALLLEGFEPAGGRAVTRQLQALFSPLDVALGYKPEGEANNLDYVPHKATASLRLLAVDNELAPVDLAGAEITLSARRYINSLVMDARGQYRYDATPVDTELSRHTVHIGPQGLAWPLPTDTPGDFLITVAKPDGAALAVIPYSVAGQRLAEPENLSPEVLAKGNLRLKLDKEHYAPGESIKMRLSAPYAGTGLITIERETVLAHAWFSAQAGDSVQEIRIPMLFEGRGYVNVSYARALDSDAVYMKPHAYAVAPFTAGLTRRDMGLRLTAPARVLPGQSITLRLTSRVPGRAQIFAVDEGVLQLTDFATPDPLRDLLADRALDVDTRQAFDLLMPDHARLRGRIPGFGGGMGAGGGRFLNPFKRRGEPPFAFWSPIVDVDQKGAEISFRLPEYLNGQVRIMAVGSATPQDGPAVAGNAQATSEVRGTLILKPLLPLAVAPGDAFEGALVIANTVEGSGAGARVRVRMECDPQLAFAGDARTEQELTVDENGEAVLRFSLRALEVPGEAAVRFSARMDAKDARAPAVVTRAQSLSVRPSSPRLRTESVLPLAAPFTELPMSRNLYPFEAVSRAEVSAAPVLGLRSLLARLNAYPYGCTEQFISRALPYAALLGAPGLRADVLRDPPEALEKRMNKSISAAVEAIRRNFTPYDGVSLWPGAPADDFVTAYAADLLLTLRENGAAVPGALTKNLLDALEAVVGRSPLDQQDGRLKVYGAWLLLRDGRVMTQELESLKQWHEAHVNDWENDVVAALMADGFSMLRLGRRADKLLPAAFKPAAGEGMFSESMARALHALVLQRHFPARRAEIRSAELLESAFNSDASTVDMAFTARALLTLARAGADGKSGAKPAAPAGLKLACLEYAPGFEPAAGRAGPVYALSLDAPGCRRFRADLPQGSGEWHLYAVADGFERAPLPQAAHGLELQRRYLNADGQAVDAAALGDVLTVELSLRTESGRVENVVLVDLLPGGFEPVLEKDGPAPARQGLIRHERREDRGIFFVNLDTEKRVFTYRVRAATRGRFILPAAVAEAMYAPEINARFGGGHLTVE